jgi:hypothetical protein
MQIWDELPGLPKAALETRCSWPTLLFSDNPIFGEPPVVGLSHEVNHLCLRPAHHSLLFLERDKFRIGALLPVTRTIDLPSWCWFC